MASGILVNSEAIQTPHFVLAKQSNTVINI